MLITKKIDLDLEKETSKLEIDKITEKVRGLFLTLGSGQAMVYEQKLKEAEAYLSDMNINPSLIPHLIKESEVYSSTILETASLIVIMANQWKMISSVIEEIRLNAKKFINEQTDYKIIRSYPSKIDWSPVTQFKS